MPVEQFLNTAPMESLVPEGTVMPKNPTPAETHVITQADLDKAAEARGQLIEELG